MNEQTAPEWRDCADPDELAAAVAAGVEVLVVSVVHTSSGLNRWNETADQFAEAIRRGARYRVPTSWTWHQEPPAPDEVVAPDDDWCEAVLNDLNSIIHGHCGSDGSDDAHCDWVNDLANEVVRYFQRQDVLAVLPPTPTDEAAGPSGPPWYLAQDVWMALGGDSNAFDAWAHHEDDRRTWGDAWAQIVAAVEGSRMEGDTNPPPGSILDLPSYQWVREPPAPPWPGAVLSGLVDEDGEPTWLAQVGQVRGEQVRKWASGAWRENRDRYTRETWVEVRAPRAVPEPETERVPWWKAKDRNGLAGDPFVEVGSDDEGPWVRVVEGGTKLHSPVAPDGTVEVLKDGGQ